MENAIYQLPAVAQCAVIGIPHDKWGEQVHAMVVLKPEETVSEQEVIDSCKSRIAGFKCPRSITFQAEPPPLSGAGWCGKNPQDGTAQTLLGEGGSSDQLNLH